MTDSDRVVVGTDAEGRSIVRYRSIGEWWVEQGPGQWGVSAYRITLADAVRWLSREGASYRTGLPGAGRFDAEMRRSHA